MNIFRIFFVSTVLIPVLVVVVTSDEAGLRGRKPRSVVISEDGTRTGRRHNPVNISDINCPSLGCSGNLTTNAYNGKGSLASTMLPRRAEDDPFPSSSVISKRRFESSSSDTTPAFHHHHQPLKLEIKSIKNSTRSDLVTYQDYIVSDDEIGTGRLGGVVTTAVVISWAVYWAWKAFLSVIVIKVISYCWNTFRRKYGIGDDYVEYYVKLGKDQKHPFGNYGGGWNPTFGISLKSKVVKEQHGWKGWQKPQGWNGWPSSHDSKGWEKPQGWSGWPSGHDSKGWPSEHHGWEGWSGWPSHKGWSEQNFSWPPPGKSESEEEEDNLKHAFDMRKGWKYAQKYTKKYGKKAHKHGLRPSKYSYMFDKDGNIVLGGKAQGLAWHRRRSSAKTAKRDASKTKSR